MTEYVPLTPDATDQAIGFMRDANPFAQRTWGWDTGRFVDWRWGSNSARDLEQPGWFGRNCSMVVSSGSIRGLMISEYGTSETCIITKGPEPDLVSEVLEDVIDERRSHRRSLMLEAASGSDWLRDVFAGASLSETRDAGHEWEYDLTAALPTAPAPEGFTITSLADAQPGDREGIAECVTAAFGSTHDVEGALRSIESNPYFQPDLSVFARSPDGRVAAYCRGTADPRNGVCGIDPVATHPDFQRLGLGKVVVLRCFDGQRSVGGEYAYIGSAPDPAPGNRLYRSLGPSERIDMSAWTLEPLSGTNTA